MSPSAWIDRFAQALAGRAGHWWPARRRIAALAVVAATLSAAASSTIGGQKPALLEWAWIVLAIASLRQPAALAALVVVGLFVVGGLLAGLQGIARLAVAPLFGGVVLTVELLAIAARLDKPVARDPGSDPRRSVIAAGIAAAVFAVVLMVGELPGPSGILAIAIASAACLALGLAMASTSAGRGS